MKRFVCVLLTVFLLLSCFAGCGEKEKHSDKLKIVATVFPPYDFARAIAGDKAEITMLIRPGSESHTFEPTPTDMKTAEECDIFISLGGESEDWAGRLIEVSGNENRTTVVLNQTVTLLEAHSGEEHHNHSEEHAHHHEHDEHIWTSPLNAIKMSQAIFSALCEKDPENKDYYTANFEALKKELTLLDESLREVTEQSNKKEIVLGDRFPFLYLTQEYGIRYHAAFPGCAEQTEPDVNTLIELIEHIKEENIGTVFYTEFSSGKIADMLCSETSAKKLLLHSCHNVTKEEWESGQTYISLMKNNLENLKIALK